MHAMQNQKRNLTYVMMVGSVAALGGLLLGYDSSVISGAIELLSHHFALTAAQTGWAVSSIIIGCVIGCLMAGGLADRYGRKKALIITILLFIVSVLGTSLAPDFTVFVVFRIIGGLGIGLASVVSPIYMAEIAPKDYRGRVMSMNMICCVGGQVIVLIVNYMIAKDAVSSWLVAYGWRWMLVAALVPSLLFLLLIGFIPESPRWNVMAGRDKAALATLTRISNEQHASSVIQEISQSLIREAQMRTSSTGYVINRKTIIFIIIGVMLAVFNQLTGINVIQYFGPSLLLNVTGSLQEAMLMTSLLAVLQFIGVLVGMMLVDRYGRRPLLLFGSLGTAVCLVLAFVTFYLGIKGYTSIIGLLGFMFIFGLSWASLAWTVIGEIFPNRLRAIGMGISIAALWAANFVISQTFPMLNKNAWLDTHFHGGFPLLLFAICCLISWWFVYRYVPETKGVSLEKIEALITGHIAKKSAVTTQLTE